MEYAAGVPSCRALGLLTIPNPGGVRLAFVTHSLNICGGRSGVSEDPHIRSRLQTKKYCDTPPDPLPPLPANSVSFDDVAQSAYLICIGGNHRAWALFHFLKAHAAKSAEYDWTKHGWTQDSGDMKPALLNPTVEVSFVHVGAPCKSEAFVHVALALNHTNAACSATNFVDQLHVVRALRCAEIGRDVEPTHNHLLHANHLEDGGWVGLKTEPNMEETGEGSCTFCTALDTKAH